MDNCGEFFFPLLLDYSPPGAQLQCWLFQTIGQLQFWSWKYFSSPLLSTVSVIKLCISMLCCFPLCKWSSVALLVNGSRFRWVSAGLSCRSPGTCCRCQQPQGFIEAALTLGTVAGWQGRGIKSALVHRLQVQDRAREDFRYLNHLCGRL